MHDIRRIFRVDGKPFFPLGGQCKNSSAYNRAESETAFRITKLLHGNTLEVPVYWNQIEPFEGHFDFTSVDELLDSARTAGLKLILLWFGTWKNGTMNYTPEWVKTNPRRFRRVVSPSGTDIWVLSSHCRANLEADKKAFTALCANLKEKDRKQGTVIALQVENEPGIIGSDRDYSPEAQSEFEKNAPNELINRMRDKSYGRLYDLWQLAGSKTSGTWYDLFESAAGELMTSWSIARYIDNIAESGKMILDIPMYVNVWLMEQRWWNPGEDYPSGGAVSKALDIYKWFAPHIDLIAPDIYIAEAKRYESICSNYARPDNSFFVPESGSKMNERNMFRAVATYNAIGYHIFALEDLLGPDGQIHPDFVPLMESMHCLAAAIPLLMQYQGTTKMQPIVQDEGMYSQLLDFDGYMGLVQFNDGTMPGFSKDWRHNPRQRPVAESGTQKLGRGLAVQTGADEFCFVGADYRVMLRPRLLQNKMLDASYVNAYMLTRLAHSVSVDEGHFNEKNEFVIDRRRNGDETDYAIWIEPDVGVVRVRMCP